VTGYFGVGLEKGTPPIQSSLTILGSVASDLASVMSETRKIERTMHMLSGGLAERLEGDAREGERRPDQIHHLNSI